MVRTQNIVTKIEITYLLLIVLQPLKMDGWVTLSACSGLRRVLYCKQWPETKLGRKSSLSSMAMDPTSLTRWLSSQLKTTSNYSACPHTWHTNSSCLTLESWVHYRKLGYDNMSIARGCKCPGIKFIPKVIIITLHLYGTYIHESIQPNVAKCKRKACVCDSKNSVDVWLPRSVMSECGRTTTGTSKGMRGVLSKAVQLEWRIRVHGMKTIIDKVRITVTKCT